MAKFDWGHADSGPWVVSAVVCARVGNGYGLCKLLDGALPPQATGGLEKTRKTVI